MLAGPAQLRARVHVYGTAWSTYMAFTREAAAAGHCSSR